MKSDVAERGQVTVPKALRDRWAAPPCSQGVYSK
jgi:hypothetical protein